MVNGTSLREILSDLYPGHAPALLHLLSCDTCRVWAIATLIEEQGVKLLVPPQRTSGPARTDQETTRPEGAVPAEAAGNLVGMPSTRQTAAAITRAAALEANARRLEGDLSAADSAVGNSLVFDAPPSERAQLNRAMALIRWERGQFDDAASLLQQTAALYGGERQLGEEGTTLTLLGLLRLEAGPPYVEVISALFPGLPALAGDRPWLAARGTLALSLALASLGQEGNALGLLIAAREIATGVFDHHEVVRFFWLEARVLGRLDKLEEAETLLTSVRAKLLAEGEFAEAVLASFDLALLHAESGRLEMINGMAAELEDVLADKPLFTNALQEFRDLRWQESGSRVERVELTALTQRKHFRRRGLGFRPLPFA